MRKKYYAYIIENEKGICYDWDTCKNKVNGVSNAKYKKFDTEDDAMKFLYGNATPADAEPEIKDNIITTPTVSVIEEPYAFVDGSFNTDTNTYGCGGFLSENGNKHKIQSSDNNPEKATMRNVAGEIMGAILAIEKAIELKLEKITLYYDYAGIENWATGAWKRNNINTQEYHAFIQKARTQIEIKFVKVPAHTGIPGNEYADRLAKEAVGIS